MKIKNLKRMLIGVSAVFAVLILVLGVHIYMVTRPKAPDAHTRIMARIDIKQDISQEDASNIATWLYSKNGVDHVLCNTANHNVVFTYFPVKANADQIIHDFHAHFNIKAQRYVPTERDMMSGCPVASKTSPVYNFFKKLF